MENPTSSGDASKTTLANDDIDLAGLDLEEAGGVHAGGGGNKERTMDKKVDEDKLSENDMLAAVSGGMGVQKTTDASNRFTRTKQLNDELYSVPMEDQLLCIVSVGGPTQHTKAESCYLRVAGYFPDEDELEDHGDDLPRGNYLSTYSAVAYHFGDKEFATAEEKQAAEAMDEEAAAQFQKTVGNRRQKYIDDMLARWELKVLNKEARFDEHVDERSNFTNDAEEKAVDAKEKETFAQQKKKREETSRALRKNYAEIKKKLADKATRKEMKKKKAKELKGAHALVDQAWMCVSLMYDLDEEDLPIKKNWIYICWGAFPSKKIARGHVSDTLQHDYSGMKHYAVKMYKWLPLDIILTAEFKKKVKGIYKTEEQQALWDGAHEAKPKAHQYIKKREEMERTAELKKMLEENKGMTTAELLKQQLEEDDEADVNVEKPAGETTAEDK